MLHLDEQQVLRARIFDTVGIAQADDDVLTRGDREDLIAAGHLPRAGDDDPVLGAMRIALEWGILRRDARSASLVEVSGISQVSWRVG